VVLPLGHGKPTGSSRALSGRERWMVRTVLGAVAALAVVLAVAIGTAGKSSAHGCIHATIAGPVGAQEVDQCGAEARSTCLTARTSGAFTSPGARVIEQQCRKAGLPVGG